MAVKAFADRKFEKKLTTHNFGRIEFSELVGSMDYIISYISTHEDALLEEYPTAVNIRIERRDDGGYDWDDSWYQVKFDLPETDEELAERMDIARTADLRKQEHKAEMKKVELKKLEKLAAKLGKTVV